MDYCKGVSMMYVSTDDTGRICATTDVEEYAEGMTEFDFPEDFDFNAQDEWRIVDGELVHDPRPVPAETRIAELKAKLEATDYIAAKAMDALLRDSASGTETLASIGMEYEDTLRQRQEWRDEINELEGNE